MTWLPSAVFYATFYTGGVYSGNRQHAASLGGSWTDVPGFSVVLRARVPYTFTQYLGHLSAG